MAGDSPRSTQGPLKGLLHSLHAMLQLPPPPHTHSLFFGSPRLAGLERQSAVSKLGHRKGLYLLSCSQPRAVASTAQFGYQSSSGSMEDPHRLPPPPHNHCRLLLPGLFLEGLSAQEQQFWLGVAGAAEVGSVGRSPFCLQVFCWVPPSASSVSRVINEGISLASFFNGLLPLGSLPYSSYAVHVQWLVYNGLLVFIVPLNYKQPQVGLRRHDTEMYQGYI